MKTENYYYNENIKSNCLDCQYPNINKQAIKDLVQDSIARYVYIYIYDEKGNHRTHWTYEISFAGVRVGEDYQKSKEKCLKKHIKKICEYIEEDYKTYCESKEVTVDMMKREMVNEWKFGLEFVNKLSSQEVKRIYELGPNGYRQEQEDIENEIYSLKI